MPAGTTARPAGIRRLCVLTLVAASGLLAACGSDDAPAPAPGSPERPLVAALPAEGGARPGTGHSVGAEPDGAQAGAAGRAARREPAARTPNYQSLVERQSKRPERRFTPCNLVSPAEASAILRSRVRAPVEAPQGPTCIYRTASGAGFVTVAVQSLDIAQIRRRLRDRRSVRVAERPAYCGVHGQPMLYASLPGSRVLAVSARCAIARAFAITALRQFER